MSSILTLAEQLIPQPSLTKRFKKEFHGLNEVFTQRIARVETKRQLLMDEQREVHGVLLANFGEKAVHAEHRHLKLFEIAYQPAITDPEHPAIQKILKTTNFFDAIEVVRLSTMYGFEGLIEDEATNLVHKYLFNPLLHVLIEERHEPETLKISSKPEPVQVISGFRKMGLGELLDLSDKRSLYMEEWAITEAQRMYREELKRDPTDAELEYLAQRTSDHCFHSTWKSLGLFKKLRAAVDEVLPHRKDIVSVFVDNAGAIQAKGSLSYFIKGETHNSPTAIAPVGGVETMHGGCIRDIMGTGQGGYPTMATQVFIVGTQKKEDMARKYQVDSFLDPLVILRGMIQGVQNYGNAMGIPNFGGKVILHPRFFGKPLALGVCVGTGEKKYSKKGTPKKGDIAILIGGPTGRDGIHGATMSSAASSESMVKKEGAAVQIGDPYTERLMMEAVPELRPYLRVFGDLGAGGIASCFGEMGEGIGIELDLTNIPVKYEGLAAWEKLESESQERMGAAVSADKLDQVITILKKHEIPYHVIGTFTGNKRFVVKHGTDKIVDLPYQWLENFPVPEKKVDQYFPKNVPVRLPAFVTDQPLQQTLLSILSHPDLADQSMFFRRWDSTVQGKSVRESCAPFTNMPYDQGIISVISTDSSVVTEKEEWRNLASRNPHKRELQDRSTPPTKDSPRVARDDKDGRDDSGVTQVLSLTANPWWSGNPYNMARACVAGSVSKQIAAGVQRNKIVLCDNFYTPKSTPKSDFYLTEMVRAITDMMIDLGTPIISGKDSSSGTTKMHRKSDGEVELFEVPPTLCITAMGVGKNAKKIPPKALQKPGNKLFLIPAGISNDMSGSVLLSPDERARNFNCEINIQEYIKTIDRISELIDEKKIKSVSVLDEGGVLHRIFEMMVGSGMGCEISPLVPPKKCLDSVEMTELLTKVLPGAFIVEVEKEDDLSGIEKTLIGTVQNNPELSIIMDAKPSSITILKLEKMKAVWEKTWYEILNLPHDQQAIDTPRKILKWKPSSLVKKHINVVYTPGINCHQEMLRSWEILGQDVKLISVTDHNARFADADIVVFPGGFADGDYLGAAKVWHQVMETYFKDQMDFLRSGKIPVLGICNGFQLMTRAGFFGDKLRLSFNESGIFQSRWVRCRFTKDADRSIWTKGMEGKELCFPVAHGEGRFVMDGSMTKATIALQYEPNVYPNNPNGSVHGIAGVFAGDKGQFFGVMPHPERAIEPFHFTRHGLIFFENVLKNL